MVRPFFMKEKHIEKLTKGKKSGANIGSRGVPHRLNQHEQKQFNLAIKKKFMTLTYDSRQNLRNIWLKYAEVKQWPALIVFRQQDGTAKVEHNGKPIYFDTYKKADQYAKECLS
jgi:hypothetical protein